MKHLRNIALDLVEKRLWPVAAVLLATLVAIPLALGSDPAPAPALPAGEAGEGAVAAQVAAAAPDQLGGPAAGGALRDPFGRAVAPSPESPASSATAAPGSAEGGPGIPPGAVVADPGAPFGGPAPDVDFDLSPGLPGPLPDIGPSGPGGSGGGAGITPSTPSAAPSAPSDADVVTVRVGRAGALRLRRDVAVRTPLPSVADPFLVYLGTKPDGVSAQFLVSADAKQTGDAACRPSNALCETIVMRAGMTEYFDVELGDGEVVQYQLDVVRVGR